MELIKHSKAKRKNKGYDGGLKWIGKSRSCLKIRADFHK